MIWTQSFCRLTTCNAVFGLYKRRVGEETEASPWTLAVNATLAHSIGGFAVPPGRAEGSFGSEPGVRVEINLESESAEGSFGSEPGAGELDAAVTEGSGKASDGLEPESAKEGRSVPHERNWRSLGLPRSRPPNAFSAGSRGRRSELKTKTP